MRYLGVEVLKQDYVWGDNDSMIRSATVPDSELHMRHSILSFHSVQSMIESGYINLQHIKSEYNLADIITKYWGYQGTYHDLIEPVFHHARNTAALFRDDTLEVNDSQGPEDIININGE